MMDATTEPYCNGQKQQTTKAKRFIFEYSSGLLPNTQAEPAAPPDSPPQPFLPARA